MSLKHMTAHNGNDLATLHFPRLLQVRGVQSREKTPTAHNDKAYRAGTWLCSPGTLMAGAAAWDPHPDPDTAYLSRSGRAGATRSMWVPKARKSQKWQRNWSVVFRLISSGLGLPGGAVRQILFFS